MVIPESLPNAKKLRSCAFRKILHTRLQKVRVVQKGIKSGGTGVIVADATQTASFINSKKKKDRDVVLGTKGSIKILKADGENSSKALAGAAFELLDKNKNVIEASEKTGKDDVTVFGELECHCFVHLFRMRADFDRVFSYHSGVRANGVKSSFLMPRSAMEVSHNGSR